MSLNLEIKKFLQSDGCLAFFLFIIFLSANGYTYAWDDQHLEIPLLKSLIDPELYPGDYYVEGLKANFTSILYPILARLIKTTQVPAVYFILYLLSRYFLFFWIYKLWRHIANERLTAFLAASMIIVIGRVDEFLYRTFSHQEFALAIIFAAIYYFYKERFILSSILFGIAADFHALYSLFPYMFLLIYLLMDYKKKGVMPFVKSIAAFSICASPFLVWALQKRFLTGPAADPLLYDNWIALYKIACPQNFILYDKTIKDILSSTTVFFETTRSYWILVSLYLLNISFNQTFKKDKKVQIIILTAFALLLISFIFSHIYPVRFVLDLNMVRNTQYMLFFLMGYTLLLMFDILKTGNWHLILLISLYLPLIRFGHFIPPLAVLAIFSFLGIKNALSKEKRTTKYLLTAIFIVGALASTAGIIKILIQTPISPVVLLALKITYFILFVIYLVHFLIKNERWQERLRPLMIISTFIIMFVNHVYYHYSHVQMEKTATGFWQLQRNWIDMQNYVREHTPKNAKLLVPHDMEMGGFRIFSERSVVVCYRDCGIVGFSYASAVEWQRRLQDIDAFQVFVTKPIEVALKNAIIKYRVNYIVFMGYMSPKESSLLKPVYQNEVFSLYQVIPNPVM